MPCDGVATARVAVATNSFVSLLPDDYLAAIFTDTIHHIISIDENADGTKIILLSGRGGTITIKKMGEIIASGWVTEDTFEYFLKCVKEGSEILLQAEITRQLADKIREQNYDPFSMALILEIEI